MSRSSPDPDVRAEGLPDGRTRPSRSARRPDETGHTPPRRGMNARLRLPEIQFRCAFEARLPLYSPRPCPVQGALGPSRGRGSRTCAEQSIETAGKALLPQVDTNRSAVKPGFTVECTHRNPESPTRNACPRTAPDARHSAMKSGSSCSFRNRSISWTRAWKRRSPSSPPSTTRRVSRCSQRA